MAQVLDQDSDVYFSGIDEESPDWRSPMLESNDIDPDDELLEETPKDVVAILGFDPLELL